MSKMSDALREADNLRRELDQIKRELRLHAVSTESIAAHDGGDASLTIARSARALANRHASRDTPQS